MSTFKQDQVSKTPISNEGQPLNKIK